MNSYQHTQRGTVIIVSMLVMAASFIGLGLCIAWQFLITTPLLLLGVWLFGSLRIEITSTDLRWRFGPGLIHKRVPLADINSAQSVRTKFIEGWGIHYSRFGWLYNVSGFNAVAVTLRNGKRFALGSDEAEILAAKLIAAAPNISIFNSAN